MFKRAVIVFVVMFAMNTQMWGTTPPRDGGAMPDAFLRLQQQRPLAFAYKRALIPWLSRVLRSRAALQSPGAAKILENMAALDPAMVQGAPVISGTKNIPVVLLKFKNTTGDESGHPLFAPSTLQRKLFDGEPGQSSPTIGEFYRETSYGLFTVRGTVYDWKALSKPDNFYEGQDYMTTQGLAHCNGLCDTGRMPDLIKEALDLNTDIDWAQYDNDGPDGVPNSGDDNGFVDFVAFAHAEHGAECDRGSNIWSHRSTLSDWTGTVYETKSVSASGGFIKIDDYTIQPAYGCGGATPNDIGVFAHEFGHAFGLPDLYDTSGRGQGLGNWCLMAGGAWGGDGRSPNQPVQMSPWAKELLGWVTPKEITADLTPAAIATIEDNPDVYRVTISPTQYYLIDNLGKKMSNSKLPVAGVQIWLVNQTVVTAGMRSNRVNSDPNNYGVDLVEADGLRRLHTPTFRGGPGDLFPGSSGNTRFDAATNPKSLGTAAICGIVAPGDTAMARVLVSSNLCPPGAVPAPATPAQGNLTQTSKVPEAGSNLLISEILANPARFLNKTVQVGGRIENKGANIQLRAGRDFQLTDASGSIGVRIPLPLETGTARSESDKATLGSVLDETVRITAVVEPDPQTGRPRLAVKNVSVIKQ